jgi:hypothetical protein
MRTLTAALLAIGTAVAGCGGIGGSPRSAVVQVANEAAETVDMAWQSPTFFGTYLLSDHGTDELASCQPYVRAFGPGQHQLTFSTAAGSVDFVVVGPANDSLVTTFLIDVAGNVQEVSPDELSADGCSERPDWGGGLASA